MGIFSSVKNKTSKYIDEVKAKRDYEALEKEHYQNELRKQEEREFNEDTRQQAINHIKEKSLNTINSKAHLADKIKAVNELYKDTARPKKSNAIQEISDRMRINRLRRDLRIEKVNTIKQLVHEDKLNKIRERNERMNLINQRNKFNKVQKEVKLILRNNKFKK